MEFPWVSKLLRGLGWSADPSEDPLQSQLLVRPDDDERRLHQRLLAMTRAAAQGRNRVPNQVEEEIALYTGNWRTREKRSPWRTNIRYNMTHPPVETSLALEMDIPMRAATRGRTLGSETTAMLWRRAFTWWEDNMRFRKVRARATKYGLIMGTRVIRLIPDEDTGTPEPVEIDPRLLLSDPTATRDADYRYQIEFIRIPRIDLAQMDPRKVRSEQGAEGFNETYPYLKTAMKGIQGLQDLDEDDNTIPVARMWWHPEDMGLPDRALTRLRLDAAEIEDYRAEIQEKYPNGRITIYTEQGIYMDEPQDFAGGSPFLTIANYDIPDSCYGMSEVSNLAGIHYQFNRLLDSVQDAIRLCGEPRYWLNKASGVKKMQLTNAPGSYVRGNGPMSENMSLIPSGTVSPDTWRMFTLLKQLADETTGISDLAQGRPAEHQQSATEIDQIAEMLRNRPKMKILNMRDGLEALYHKVMHQWKDAQVLPQWLRVSGLNQREVAQLQQRLPIRLGQDAVFLLADMDQLDTDIDIAVDVGKGLAKSQLDHLAITMKMWDRGDLKTQKVLDLLDFPERQGIIDELDKREAAAAAMAGGVPGAGPAAGGPPTPGTEGIPAGLVPEAALAVPT